MNRRSNYPDPEKRSGGPNKRAERKHQLNIPDDAPSRDHDQPDKKETTPDPSGELTRPVTNQDEQRQITNSDNNNAPFGENEREGD